MTDFGVDTWCTDSLRTSRLVSGVAIVAQAVYHRLITERGSLRGGEEEANFGFDLTELVGSIGGVAPMAYAKAKIRNEVRKDQRVQDAEVDIQRTTDGPAESWVVSVIGYTAAGPFSLVLSVSDVTISLVGLTA